MLDMDVSQIGNSNWQRARVSPQLVPPAVKGIRRGNQFLFRHSLPGKNWLGN